MLWYPIPKMKNDIIVNNDIQIISNNLGCDMYQIEVIVVFKNKINILNIINNYRRQQTYQNTLI